MKKAAKAPGLARMGDSTYPDHARPANYAPGLDRNGDTEIASYSERTGGKNFGIQHPGDVGMKRAGDNKVFNLKHPGTRKRGTVEREPFARDEHWHGTDGQRQNYQ